jgi:hypothetical protein
MRQNLQDIMSRSPCFPDSELIGLSYYSWYLYYSINSYSYYQLFIIIIGLLSTCSYYHNSIIKTNGRGSPCGNLRVRSTPLELGQSQCCQRRLWDRAEFGTGSGPEFDGLVALVWWLFFFRRYETYQSQTRYIKRFREPVADISTISRPMISIYLTWKKTRNKKNC